MLFVAALKYMNIRKKDLFKKEADIQLERYIYESIKVVDSQYGFREEDAKAALFATLGTGLNFFSVLLLLIDIPDIH